MVEEMHKDLLREAIQIGKQNRVKVSPLDEQSNKEADKSAICTTQVGKPDPRFRNRDEYKRLRNRIKEEL